MDIVTHQPKKLKFYPNLSDRLLSETGSYVNIQCPTIKSRDERCSRGCVKNWTMFGDKPPVYQLCHCRYKHFQYKN